MPPTWKAVPPKGDFGYFDHLSKAIFNAGLNWNTVEKKWPNFQKAFRDFSPERIAKLTERDVQALMRDPGIVRNEKKIRATIQNAKVILEMQKEYGSVKGYVDSFGKREGDLLKDLPTKFEHVGPSTARMFLWMVGYPLTPTKEEKMWMKGHHDHQ